MKRNALCHMARRGEKRIEEKRKGKERKGKERRWKGSQAG